MPFLFLTGCISMQSIRSIPEEPGTYIEVVTLQDKPSSPDKAVWLAKFRFYENTKYKHIIQILYFESGHTLIEAFDAEKGWPKVGQYDVHWSERYQVRKIVTYPGNVEGANWSPKGFCMLPENEQGVKTNVGKQFNKKYREKYKLAGRVTEADQTLGVRWKIVAREGDVRAYVPEDSLVRP